MAWLFGNAVPKAQGVANARLIAAEAVADLRLGASVSVLVNRDLLSVLAEAASDSADYFGELAKDTDPEETAAAADYRSIAEERGQVADAAWRILGHEARRLLAVARPS